MPRAFDTVPPSPCNRVCKLDLDTGFCLGCGRTAAEIGAWTRLTAEQRQALLAALPGRLAAGGLPPGRRRW